MPRCVFRADTQGVTLPRRSLRRIIDVWACWCAEQNIDSHHVEAVEVTEFDNGELVAYCTRWELMPPIERMTRLALSKTGDVAPQAVYPNETPMVRRYLTHHPVTSIQLLLDAAYPQAVAR